MIHLSQVIGQPVRDQNGEAIGKVADLIVAVGERYPPVTGLVINTDRRQIFLPWSSVAAVDVSGATLSTSQLDITKFSQRPNEILLKLDLLDKQIVDIDGRRVVRVNDVSLDEVEGSLRLVAVDVGTAGLLRRLGIERPYRRIARGLGRSAGERYIDWEDVDPVETSIASIRLRIPHAGLTELHPADLATIIDQLAPRDRYIQIECLGRGRAQDVEVAADGPDVTAQERPGQCTLNSQALAIGQRLPGERRVDGERRLLIEPGETPDGDDGIQQADQATRGHHRRRVVGGLAILGQAHRARPD